MGINIILGRQGSGKTLFLIKKAWEYYKQGRTVYSNVHLTFPYKKLDYNDIINCKLESGIVIIDEIHLLLSARNSMSKRSRVITDNFISQLRKRDISLFCTSQTLRKIDVKIRDECDFLYYCDKFAYINNTWVNVMHNQNLNKNIKIMITLEVQEMFSMNTTKIFFIGNEYFNKYDTSQIIKIEDIDVKNLESKK